jgi:hypothetical protein
MNDRLLEILSARPDFSVTGSDKKALEVFVEYLDRGSLFMTGYEAGDSTHGADPVFSFSNDAQIYTFKLSEIVELVAQMKQGVAIDWEKVPYTYVTRP